MGLGFGGSKCPPPRPVWRPRPPSPRIRRHPHLGPSTATSPLPRPALESAHRAIHRWQARTPSRYVRFSNHFSSLSLLSYSHFFCRRRPGLWRTVDCRAWIGPFDGFRGGSARRRPLAPAPTPPFGQPRAGGPAAELVHSADRTKVTLTN